MCKSVLLAGVAALSIASAAGAQSARLDVQVSTDNQTWSDSIFAPAGSIVYVRVVASTTAPNAVGLASVTYQPTLTGWTSGDTRMVWTTPTGAATDENSGVPANTGRMRPFGSVSMASGSTPGLLSSFVDGGTRLRIAGSRATTMNSNLAYGVVSSQIAPSLAGAAFNNSLNPVIFKYAVQLSNAPELRTMIADIPLSGVQFSRTQWYTSLITGTGNPTNITLTAADIDPATINVGPPNFPPVATNDTYSMLEDQTLFVTTGGVLVNDTDQDENETLTAELVSTTANGALTLNADGTFSYIPSPDYFGVETFRYIVRDRFSAASNIATVTINVADVNDEPVFTASDPTAITEDFGPRTIAGWASFNPGNREAGQGVLEYEVMGVSNGGLFSQPPTVSSDGTLRYTSAPDLSGSATFTVRVRDTGGTANGGVDMSPPAVFTIDVMPVNDAPTFTASPIAAVAEDSGLRSIANWAAFNPGPEEATQTLLGYAVSNISNPSLFSVAPTVAGDGTLVFQPAPDAVGTSTFSVTARDSGGTANGGVDTSAPQVFTITVNPVNDAPVFTASNPPAVNEDSGPQTRSNWAAFNPGGGAAEASQSVAEYLVTNVSDPTAFAAGPSVSNSGVLTYTPAPNAHGTFTFQVRVRDNGGTAAGGIDTSAPQTFTVTINPVNDAPSFAASNPAATLEDAGPVAVSAWATFNPGPNEASQAVQSYIVSAVSNPSLFASGPSVEVDGTLSYTTAANASGSSTFQVRVRDNGGTASGGVDLSPTQTFTISVTPVNDAPIVTLGNIPTVIEDAGPQTVFGFASFNAGGGETGQSLLGYTVSDVSNPAMFAAGPSVSMTGVLTYTPAPNASGTATFVVRAQDNGGTANGGVDISAPVVGTINITDINDAPTFTASNPVVNEDAGPVSIANWAAFNAGPFETSQSVLAYTVANVTNGSLFVASPSVGTDGTLAFQTAANAFGTATFQVRVRDNGGTAFGGVDTSSWQTITVTVNPVNDAPTLALGAIPTINEDSGIQMVPGFATFSPGPGESSQALAEYVVSNVSNPASFSMGPVVTNGGVLMYMPAPDASGNISFTVRARDNGGTENGGQDLSAPQLATFTIVGVNDPPVARARDVLIDTRGSCLPRIVPPLGVDAGSSDPDNPAAELTFSLDYQGEFPIGVTPVRLTVTDPEGLSSSATAMVTVLANDTNGNQIPDSCDIVAGGGGPDCDGDGDNDESQCLWDNGAASPVNGITNGQLSQYGGNPSARVADDFYLSPGLVYRLTSFRAQIVTNSIERGARLSIFEDCDGAPVGEPLFTVETLEVSGETPTNDPGFSLVQYVFNLCDEKLVLEGDRTYWVSVQGKVDCNLTDRAYWASVGVSPRPRDMIGSVPYKAVGLGDHPCTPDGYAEWETIADCCIGCVNMAYLMTGERCQVLWDNGIVDLGPTRGGAPSGINRAIFSRAADNIALKPCRDEDLCFIEAWIWTNCNPVVGYLEFYDNLCAMPTGQPVYRATPTEVIPIEGETVVIDGTTFQLYLLKFWQFDFRLQGNKNYWLSVGADGTGSFNARSFFAYASDNDPCNPCERRQITYGAVLPNRNVTGAWDRIDREFAFRIATKPYYLEVVRTGQLPANFCPPDVNRTGDVTVQDLFDFINDFFAGCP